MNHRFVITIPLAILITLGSIIYQRTTGPTYPKRFYIEHQGQEVKIPLLRSHGGKTDAPIEVPRLSEDMKAQIFYRRYPTNDPWSKAEFAPQKAQLVAQLPHQPPAGKLQYYVQMVKNGETIALGSKEDPIMIRFKGAVPTWVLGPHIFFMFFAMLLSSLAGLEALFKTRSFYPLTLATLGCLGIGGMILGPFVQKYAFGVYWAGFPFGWDLTDNKLLIGVGAWLIAAIASAGKKRPWATVAAALVLIGVYSIPHSMMGSQYNYETNQVETDR